MRSQKGIGHVVIILIIGLIMVVGGVGWWVWKNNKADDKKLAQTSTPTTQQVTIESDSWTEFSSTEGDYYFRHPPWWHRAANLENCNPGLFMAGATDKWTGTCGSEDFGQIIVSSVEGNRQSEFELGEGYTNITRAWVDVNGVSGNKMTGVSSGQRQESEIGTTGLSDGVEVTTYIIYTNDRTYVATYRELTPPVPNGLRDFTTMMHKTFRYSAD